MNHEEHLALDLSKMEVPAFKQDVTRPGVIKWLLDNLRVKNQNHPKYREVMTALLAMAVRCNLVRKKEIRAYEAHLLQLEHTGTETGRWPSAGSNLSTSPKA